jgi:fumarate reductase flavoprotein subunit
VLIVEKMPTIGGNTIKGFCRDERRGNRFQRVKGIQDSKELFYQESLKGGHNKNNPELLRAVEMRRKPLSGWRIAALCSTTSPPPAG